MYSVLSTLSLFSGHFLRLERQEVYSRFSAPEAAVATAAAATTATAAEPGSQAKETEQFKRNNHILSIPKVKSSLGEEDNYFVYRADLTLSTLSLGKNETSPTQIAALFSLVKKENRSGFEKPC